MTGAPKPRRITSRDNPDFRRWKKLAQSSRARRRSDYFLLEGLHLIVAWQASFGAPELLLTCEAGISNPEIRAWLDQAAGHFVELPDALFRELADTETPSGLLAVAACPPPAAPPAVDRDSLLLDGIQDPGNLGVLLRSAAAAGIRQILLSADCAAAWSPKALRAGQGAHFVTVLHENVDLPLFLSEFRGDTLATTLEGAVSLYAAKWRHPVAWVMGSEGQGIRPNVLAACRQRLCIPMIGAMESLNVGAAAAVCLFEMVRRRESKPRLARG